MSNMIGCTSGKILWSTNHVAEFLFKLGDSRILLRSALINFEADTRCQKMLENIFRGFFNRYRIKWHRF